MGSIIIGAVNNMDTLTGNGIVLHRTTAPGSSDSEFMCEHCLEKYEPELFKNIKQDPNDDIIETIKDIDGLFHP